MQFKGSVRAPGDRDPGVRVVLDIDEYHLEIRRDAELIGRYYLADVEVARDVAERFILFLGEDEVEFMADDTLQFAYDGVTAMQDAWLAAQKKKRRHRRAAEAAARRKDDQPQRDAPVVAAPTHVSESDTIRSRRQAATQSPASSRPAAAGRPAPVTGQSDTGTYTPKTRTPPPIEVPPPPEVAFPPAPAPEEEKIAVPVERIRPASPPPRKHAPTRRSKDNGSHPSVPAEARDRFTVSPDATSFGETLDRTAEVIVPDVPAEAAVEEPVRRESFAPESVPDAAADTSLAARRRKIAAKAASKIPPDLAEVTLPESLPIAPEPISSRADPVAPSGEQVIEEIAAETETEVRYDQSGHHPSETSTGLLARLRRPPRRSAKHVHTFEESRSSVGLVRRVCTECAYVSIGSWDEDEPE